MERDNTSLLRALYQTAEDISMLMEKKKAKLKEKKPFSIVINGYTYNYEDEIIDAYGGGFMSNSQKERALKKLHEYEEQDHQEILKIEINCLNNIAWNLRQEMLQIEENNHND